MTRWLALAVVVVFGLGLDLLAHRGDQVDSPKRAIAWTSAWVAVAIGFGVWIGLDEGWALGAQFFSAYLVEESLSVDNLLVFLLVFSRLEVPATEQRRVLFWGIVGAIAMRGAFIAAGVAAMTRWHFVTYGFGAILLFTGVRLAVRRPKDEEPRVIDWLRRWLPISNGLAGHRFFVRESGRWAATPLLFALLTIEVTDVFFAVDSIPAVFGIANEPFVLYASNILAVLGLRALFVVVAALLARLRYIRFGVAVILVFVGAKMLGASWFELPPWVSLALIATVLAATIAASMLNPKRRRDARRPSSSSSRRATFRER